MTVALGLVCKDGVLVAADSMGTGEGFASISTKVHTFGRCPAIWTAAGSVFVKEEVEKVIENADSAGTPEKPTAAYTDPIPSAIRTGLGKAINKAMGDAYARALSTTPMAPGAIHANFASSFLVLGYANDVPWFLEFAHDGQINWHTERGFYAVGSGGPFATVAHALMSHYATDDLTLDKGKKLAYRTIQTTIDVSPQGVGPPVQMAVCDAEGARVLSAEEVDKVGFAVEGWKVLERETLTEAATELAEEAEHDLPTIEGESGSA